MKRTFSSILLSALVGAAAVNASVARGEDVQLRNQAVSLLNRSHIVSQIQGGPYNFRTEATFTATAGDGCLQSGSYMRVRGSDGALREDLRDPSNLIRYPVNESMISGAQVLIKNYNMVGHFMMHLTIPTIRLADWSAH
ncbi:MAG TPA: hypothetical protein VHT24_06900 [Pseudacidobacterium sp.]|nr:hypothetical protein [Pseudacidobacterium sp.]